MSFCRTNDTVKEGDTVIIYVSFNKLYPIQIKKGKSHSTKYGTFSHAELIGKKFGTKFQCKNGTVHILAGSPEMWTLCLPHRTQILYTPNISVITLQLELKPGSVVVESGTGSASLSHALVRTIYPTGHLHTFEFHSQRAETAKKEFLDHGMGEYVTVYNRDVCNDGFNLEDVADAVFLDLPSPWKALESAKKALKREGGRICSFSPCIEQVQKTSLDLTKLGFTNIITIESLRRVLCVKKYDMQEFDFNMDWRKPDAQQPETPVPTGTETAATGDGQEKKEEINRTTPKAVAAKRGKKEENNGGDSEDESDPDVDATASAVPSIYTAKPINMQPGHTGFLTFATLLHKDFS